MPFRAENLTKKAYVTKKVARVQQLNKEIPESKTKKTFIPC